MTSFSSLPAINDLSTQFYFNPVTSFTSPYEPLPKTEPNYVASTEVPYLEQWNLL
jgi:hypothetical protein